MNRKTWLRGSVVLAAGALLGGCTAPIGTQVSVTDPAPGTLRVGSLAMLPLTVDPGLEEYGRMAGDGMHAELVAGNPGLPIVPPEQALERLVNARATTAYSNLVAQYEETGQLNPELVRELGDAVGARYLLNLRLTYAEDAGFGPGDFANETYEGQGLRVIAQLWDGERGVLEWRMVGDVSAVASDLMRERSMEDLLGELLPRMADAVPIHGGETLADVPVQRGPEDRTVFMGTSGLLLLAFLLL